MKDKLLVGLIALVISQFVLTAYLLIEVRKASEENRVARLTDGVAHNAALRAECNTLWIKLALLNHINGEPPPEYRQSGVCAITR
jgi:hypothetical protein